MPRFATALAGVTVAMVAALAGWGSAATSGHGILFLRTEANPRLQQIQLWHRGASPRPLGPSSDWILTPQWSPDGESIAFAAEQGGWDDPAAYDIWTMRSDGSGAKQLTRDSEDPTVFRADEPSWSPGGRRIVFVRELANKPYDELVVVDVRTGRERTLPATGPFGSPAWGKPGIAYEADYRRLMLLSPAGGRPKLLGPAFGQWSVLTWSSRSVLAALEVNRVILYYGSGRQAGRFSIPFRASRACGIAWSPDGKRLLLRTGGKHSSLWTATAAGTRWRRLPLALGKTNRDNCAVSWR
jgi:Tol biopolymer transport system component